MEKSPIIILMIPWLLLTQLSLVEGELGGFCKVHLLISNELKSSKRASVYIKSGTLWLAHQIYEDFSADSVYTVPIYSTILTTTLFCNVELQWSTQRLASDMGHFVMVIIESCSSRNYIYTFDKSVGKGTSISTYLLAGERGAWSTWSECSEGSTRSRTASCERTQGSCSRTSALCIEELVEYQYCPTIEQTTYSKFISPTSLNIGYSKSTNGREIFTTTLFNESYLMSSGYEVSSNAQQTSDMDPPSNVGAIVGAVIGSVVLLCAIIVLAFIIIYCRRRNRNADAENKEMTQSQVIMPDGHESNPAINQDPGGEYSFINHANRTSCNNNNDVLADGNNIPCASRLYENIGCDYIDVKMVGVQETATTMLSKTNIHDDIDTTDYYTIGDPLQTYACDQVKTHTPLPTNTHVAIFAATTPTDATASNDDYTEVISKMSGEDDKRNVAKPIDDDVDYFSINDNDIADQYHRLGDKTVPSNDGATQGSYDHVTIEDIHVPNLEDVNPEDIYDASTYYATRPGYSGTENFSDRAEENAPSHPPVAAPADGTVIIGATDVSNDYAVVVKEKHAEHDMTNAANKIDGDVESLNPNEDEKDCDYQHLGDKPVTALSGIPHNDYDHVIREDTFDVPPCVDVDADGIYESADNNLNMVGDFGTERVSPSLQSNAPLPSTTTNTPCNTATVVNDDYAVVIKDKLGNNGMADDPTTTEDDKYLGTNDNETDDDYQHLGDNPVTPLRDIPQNNYDHVII